ncbi:MAG: tyrosine-type recombinase/integrase [Candidatus Omnitrophota bacterium]
MSYYVPTEKEVMDLLSKPDLDTVKGRRDKAILELLYSSGLRREEMHNLNIDDIDFTENTVRVNQGKFKKDRVVPLGKVAKESLLTYLKRSRSKWLKDAREKALFLSERGGRLSSFMFHGILKSYADNKRITVHSLRHACATHMLKRGADIIHIQKLLGHSSPKTTEIYTKLFPNDILNMYKKIGLRKPDQKMTD